MLLVCECASVMILVTELDDHTVQFPSCLTTFVLVAVNRSSSVQDRRKEVTHSVPPVVFSVFYMCIKVNQK